MRKILVLTEHSFSRLARHLANRPPFPPLLSLNCARTEKINDSCLYNHYVHHTCTYGS